MRMFELGRYSIPEKIIEAWIREMGEELLPIQERAIRLYRVLEGTSLVVSSPVSLGKTFLGEIAAVKNALEGKKIVYLVPRKSSAEEKYLKFREKYEPFGIRIVVSSRCHWEYDRMTEAGESGIAVITYDKMAQLTVRYPFWLSNIDLVIIDELQEIGDPNQGPGLEITLTKIITSPHRPQIIGLATVQDNVEVLAQWLGVDLLSHDRRPVELHKNGIYKAAFQYRTRDIIERQPETLTGMASDESADILLANVVHLIEKGDQVLIILPSRIDTMVFARILTDRINLACALGALKELARLEETTLKRGLNYCLRKSVAFHHADLSRKERSIVERHARRGKIKVIFSTATVAVGVNLPATTIVLHTHKRETDDCNHVTLTPIGWVEYENIGGNAGRQRLGLGLGRPITIAGDDYERQTLRKNKIEKEARMLASRLNEKGLETHLLNILASGLAKNIEELETFLCWTFMGLSECRGNITKNVETALRFLLDNGFVEQDDRNEMKVSSLGTIVALKGITCLTAIELASFFGKAGDRDLTNLEILDAIASSDDGKRVYVQVARNEHRGRKYDQFMREIFEGQQEFMGTLFSYVIKSPLLFAPDEAKTRRQVLLLDRWIQGKKTPSLERDFESYHNATARTAEEMSWIMDAGSLIAQSIDFPKSLQDRLSILAERLLYGVEEKGLELARFRVVGLGRAGIRKLVKDGFANRKTIKETPLTILASIIPKKIATKLKLTAEESDKAPEEMRIVETVLADETFVCRDRMKITGEQKEKRNLVIINGSPVGITNRSLELLLRFALALKKDGKGWIHKEDFASGVEATQFISRLRNEIRSLTLKKDGNIIENDGSGSYRLSIPPQNVVIDAESLMKHWNAVIRELVISVKFA